MAQHTFVVSGGLRVEIQPSKTEPGAVMLALLYSSRDRFGCVTIPASTAAVIAQALAFEAVAAESLETSARLAKGLAESVSGAQACGCGIKDDARECHCSGGRVEAGGSSLAADWVGYLGPVGRAMVQAHADTNGVPPMRALPVVDVAQVGA